MRNRRSKRPESTAPQLVNALSRLEYRGYDSCGIAVQDEGRLRSERTLRRVTDLQARVLTLGLEAQTCIAHTRWATHGAPSEMNAHPIMSGDTIAVVHNGIIENHDALRVELRERGYTFRGQTDTEVIAHLIHSLYRDDLFDAVVRAVKRLHGAYAIAVLSAKEPQRLSPRARLAARDRHRRRTELPRVGLRGTRRPDRPLRLPGRRRRRADHAGPDRRGRLGRARGPAPVVPCEGARRRRRARPVPAFHAEGDLRAAEGDRQHARRHRHDFAGVVRRDRRHARCCRE